MKRLLLTLCAALALVLPLDAQQPPALSPMSITPAVNLTICPPPPNALAVCSLFTSTTAASNVSTTETDLISYSLPANTLSANGQKVRVTVFGTTANNANNKTIKVYFGATVVVSDGAAAFTNIGWIYRATVIRSGATTQVAFSEGNVGNGTSVKSASSAPSETLSGAVTIKVTGTSATASNDVTATGMYVEWVP